MTCGSSVREPEAGAVREGLRIYNLFPTLAGTIRQWAEHLPRIAAMGFNAVYVNPFHYPGFSGSLYAVKDYYRLNPRFRGDEREDDDSLLRGFTRGGARRWAAGDHGSRRQPHLEGQRAGRRPPRLVRPRRQGRDPVAVRDRSGRSRLARPCGAISPNSITEGPQRRQLACLFPGARAPLCGPRLWRLSLRRGLQGPGRGLARP